MASEYRGAPELNQQGTNNVRQYSQVTKTPSFPKKEQAIILNINDNLKLSDYVIAVGNIIQAKNILFASRISNNRICIYLSTVELVDTITQQTSIKINGLDIGLRRLITPAKRLILSNVCPSIPHDILENEILKLGYTAVSPMSFLRAGISGDEYAHILSFRRQIYILPNNDIELPASIVIPYEGVSYRIFVSFDSVTCFICKGIGHIAKQCPAQALNANEITSGLPEDIVSTDTVEVANELISQEIITNENTAKRPPSSPTISPADLNLEDPTSTQTSNFALPKDTRPTKKLKKSNSMENTSLSDQMKPIESHINEAPNNFILNFQQLTSFFEDSFGSSDPLSIAHTYTKDVPALLKMIHNIYPYLQHRSIKSRCTRLQKKIRKQLNLVDITCSNDSDSDSSISSQINSA